MNYIVTSERCMIRDTQKLCQKTTITDFRLSSWLITDVNCVLRLFIYVNHDKFVEVSDIPAASIFRVTVWVSKGVRFCLYIQSHFVKQWARNGKWKLVPCLGQQGQQARNVCSQPFIRALESTKKTDWQLIFQCNRPSECSPGITLFNFVWCVSSGKERGKAINMG